MDGGEEFPAGVCTYDASGAGERGLEGREEGERSGGERLAEGERVGSLAKSGEEGARDGVIE